jgi:hypothetical protein
MLFPFSTLDYCNANKDQNYDECNDLVESSLNIIETLILKSTAILKKYDQDIIKIGEDLVTYDPNYTYSENEGMEEEANTGEEWQEYNNEFAADDSSWKVRRGAVKVILALAKSRMELKREYVASIIHSLVECLRERDEKVKLEVVLCLNTYLRNFIVEEADEGLISSELTRKSSMAGPIIHDVIDPLMEKIRKDLKSKNEQIRTSILQMLSTLGLVASNEVVKRLEFISKEIDSSLKENNVN